MWRILILLLIPFSAWGLPATLEISRPATPDLAGGSSIEYVIPLDQEQYVAIRIEAPKFDCALKTTVTGPEGQIYADVFGPVSPPLPFTVSWIARSPGDYHVSIQSLEKEDFSARLKIQIDELRRAEKADADRISANNLFLQAEHLKPLGTAEAWKQCLEIYKSALDLFGQTNDAHGRALTLLGLARTHDSLGEKKKALELYQDALAVFTKLNDVPQQSNVLNYMALVQDFLGDRKKALSLLDQALEAAQKSGNRRTEGLIFNNYGLVYFNTGDRQKAADHYSIALDIAREVHNLRGVAVSLSNLGNLYGAIGEKNKGIDYFMQALKIRQEIGDAREEAVIHNNIGALYVSMDMYDETLQYYQQALQLWKKAGDRAGEAATVHNIAFLYVWMGEYQKSLDSYDEALKLERSNSFRVGEGNTLTNLGFVYTLLGDYPKALDVYNRALTIQQEVQNRTTEASVLTYLGATYDLMGQPETALGYFEKALPIRRAVTDPYGEAITLNYIGRARLSLNQPQQALEACSQALPLVQRTESRRGEGLTLACIGEAHSANKSYDEAARYFDDSASMMHQIGDRQGEAKALYGAARNEWLRANYAAAENKVRAALDVTEELRSRLPGQDLRSLYLASVRDYYDILIDSLMQQSAAAESPQSAAALQVSEHSRARALLDLLREGDVDIRHGVDSALLKKNRLLELRLNARIERQVRLLSGKHSETEAASLAAEIKDIYSEYQQAQARIRDKSPEYAALTQPPPITLDGIQHGLLDADTQLLEYSLGEQRSYLWVVSRDQVKTFALPARNEIERAAQAFLQLLKSGTAVESLNAGIRLTDLILRPAQGELRARRLVIVTEGALQYIPFSALPDPASGDHRPLIVSRELVHLPSASVLAEIRRENNHRARPQKTIAVFADPVFRPDDPRVTIVKAADVVTPAPRSAGHLMEAAENFQFPRLIGSRREAALILGLVPPDKRKEAMDFEANRATAVGGELSQFRILHFATHGLVDANHPELSGLVLSLVNRQGASQEGFLTLHDIYNLNLSADLVVLSACETALGKEIKGEGLIGLTRGFLYAGAARVVSSLWKVDDEATAELMKDFYRNLLERKMAPAAALRAAQITVRSSKRWQSPYYWAAFVLQGEWK